MHRAGMVKRRNKEDGEKQTEGGGKEWCGLYWGEMKKKESRVRQVTACEGGSRRFMSLICLTNGTVCMFWKRQEKALCTCITVPLTPAGSSLLPGSGDTLSCCLFLMNSQHFFYPQTAEWLCYILIMWGRRLGGHLMLPRWCFGGLWLLIISISALGSIWLNL